MTQPAPAPVPQTVQDVLNSSPVGPLLHQPVHQVLASLGIPPLPQLSPLPPLPGLPPIPALDPATLMKPITDMFGHLGTGTLGSAGSLDPTQVLSDVAGGLNSVISLGSTALGLLSSLQGQGVQQAATKSAEAQSNTAAVSEQATGISSLVGLAAGVVQVGNAELAAIAAKLAGELTVAATVPGGAPFGAAAAAEASVEAAAVIAHVKAELAVLAAQMTAVGQPVPITEPPNSVQAASTTAKTAAEPTAKAAVADTAKTAATAAEAADATNATGTGLGQGADALEGALQPVAQLAPMTGLSPDALAAAPLPSVMPMAAPAEMLSTTGGFGGGDGSVAMVAGAGEPVAGEPLADSTLDAPVEQAPVEIAAHADPAALATTEAGPGALDAARSGAPMMPMSSAGMLGRAGAADEETHGSVVHAQHGDEVVGELDGVVAPVVGAAIRSGPSDEALTL